MSAIALASSVHAHVCKATQKFHDDRRFVAEILEKIPAAFSHKFLKNYERISATQGRREANLYLLALKSEAFPELFANTKLPFQATDGDIEDEAEKAAKQAGERIRLHPSLNDSIAALTRLAREYGVPTPNKSADGIFRRMTEPRWWKSALRRRFQKVEQAAIRAGLVHSKAAPIISDEGLMRAERHARTNARIMASLDAVNQTTGQVIPMQDIVEMSQANPAHRRSSTMVRVRGMEDYARERGFAGYFLTLTTPSRMHARLELSGDANPRYDGTSPKKAHRYLCNVWSRSTRKLQREGIEVFGLRVAEPHHDGTPHWHLLVYVHPDRADELHAILSAYALADSPNEYGAQERRFKSVLIDPARGAAGYVAKYVSKNLDGVGVGDNDESGKPANVTALRTVAWSRLHDIRQFQFFGLGSITPTRELYRLTGLPLSYQEKLGEMFTAIKDNDYGAFLKAALKAGIRLGNHTEECKSTRYPDELIKRVRGVHVPGLGSIVTRTDVWVIQAKPKAKTTGFASLGLDSITPRNLISKEYFWNPANDNLPFVAPKVEELSATDKKTLFAFGEGSRFFAGWSVVGRVYQPRYSDSQASSQLAGVIKKQPPEPRTATN